MKKEILVSIVVGLTLTGIAQGLVSKEEAIRMVKEEILKEDTLKVWLYIYPEPLPKNFVVWTKDPGDGPYINPYQSWFFFIDDNPSAEFEHPCRYLFFRFIDRISHHYSVIYEMRPPSILDSMERIIPLQEIEDVPQDSLSSPLPHQIYRQYEEFPTSLEILDKKLVSKEEAIRILKEKILREDTLKVWVYIYPIPLSEGFVVTSGLYPGEDYCYVNPYFEGWFFFIDDLPPANWAHKCRYLFFYLLDEDYQAYLIIYEMYLPNIWRSLEQIIPPQGIRENTESPFYPHLEIYPTPSSNRIFILCNLPKESFIKLRIFSLSGRLIRELTNNIYPPGVHYFYWNRTDDEGHEVPQGVYICRLTTQDTEMIRKIVIVK